MNKKINIFTSGRFHVLDLAKELKANDFDIKFYSYVPAKRLKSFGLNSEDYVSLFLPLLPFIALEKIFKNVEFFKKIKIFALDYLSAALMRKADFTIAMSGLFIKTLQKAKKENSIIIVERGSKHIVEQKRILENIPSLSGTDPVPPFDVKREVASYDLADVISVASRHVEESFSNFGNLSKKIFVNPYGVDLKDFYHEDAAKKYDVIIVGNWSYQKGVDLLWKACKDLNVSLLHVGAAGDCLFPEDVLFTHQDAVDQKELVHFYNHAKISCLASRQDGFGMVLSQAIACGLPLVCSMHTGGADLKILLQDSSNIYVMTTYDVENLKMNIKEALAAEKENYGDLEILSWTSYGKRYSEFLNTIL